MNFVLIASYHHQAASGVAVWQGISSQKCILTGLEPLDERSTVNWPLVDVTGTYLPLKKAGGCLVCFLRDHSYAMISTD